MSCLRRTLWVKEPTRGEMGKVLVVGPSEHQADGSRATASPRVLFCVMEQDLIQNSTR